MRNGRVVYPASGARVNREASSTDPRRRGRSQPGRAGGGGISVGVGAAVISGNDRVGGQAGTDTRHETGDTRKDPLLSPVSCLVSALGWPCPPSPAGLLPRRVSVLRRLRLMRSLSRRLGPVAAAALLLGVGYFLGSVKSDPLAAQPAGKGVVPAAGTVPAAPPAAAAGDKRVIAYIHGSTPITRE